MKRLLALLTLAFFSSVAYAADPLPAPAVEVRVKAIADLTGIIEYAGGVLMQPEAGKQFAEIVKTLAATEKGLEGIDATQPIGGYVRISENIADSAIVVMVPVKDETAFVAFLKDKLNVEAKKGKEDIYTIELPQLPLGAIHFRFLHGYAYATIRNVKSIDPESVIKPKEFFTAPIKSIATVEVHWNRFPADVKKVLVGQIEMQLAENFKDAGGSALQKQARKILLEIGVDAVQTVLLDSRDLSLTLDADPKTDTIAANLKLVAKPNTQLDKNLKSWADRESTATSISVAKNPLASLGLQAKLPPVATEKLGKIVDTLFDDALAGADEGAKPLLTKLVDAVSPTLKNGDIQFGAVVTKPGNERTVQLNAALKATKGEDLEAVLREFAPFLMGETNVKFDSEKFAGRNLHEANVSNDDLKHNFGHEKFWLATSDDLIALGIEEKPTALKAFLEAKPKKLPMASFEISASQLLTMTEKDLAPEKLSSAMQAAFGKQSPIGVDTLKVSITGGDELNLKVALKGSAFKLMAAVDQEKKK